MMKSDNSWIMFIVLIILIILFAMVSTCYAEYYVLYKAKLSLFWQPSAHTKYYKVMIEPLGESATLVCYTRHPSVVVTLPQGKTVRFYLIPLDKYNHAWPSKRSPYSDYLHYAKQ